MENRVMRNTLLVTKALSDVQRVRILMMLEAGECCVCQIVEVLGLAASTVSRHLYLLTGAGLVLSRKDGRWSYYRLPEGGEGAFASPVMQWLSRTLANEETIQNDRRVLSEIRAEQRKGSSTGPGCRSVNAALRSASGRHPDICHEWRNRVEKQKDGHQVL